MIGLLCVRCERRVGYLGLELCPESSKESWQLSKGSGSPGEGITGAGLLILGHRGESVKVRSFVFWKEPGLGVRPGFTM